MAQYASDRSTPLIDGNVFYVFGTDDWPPAYDKIKDEIAAGRTLLLGFAPAETGSYDKIKGHMTLCTGGASTNAELNDVKVVGGHASSIVMKTGMQMLMTLSARSQWSRRRCCHEIKFHLFWEGVHEIFEIFVFVLLLHAAVCGVRGAF